MADLFSNEWAEAFKDAWNGDEEITGSLQRAGFNSVAFSKGSLKPTLILIFSCFSMSDD